MALRSNNSWHLLFDRFFVEKTTVLRWKLKKKLIPGTDFDDVQSCVRMCPSSKTIVFPMIFASRGLSGALSGVSWAMLKAS